MKSFKIYVIGLFCCLLALIPDLSGKIANYPHTKYQQCDQNNKDINNQTRIAKQKSNEKKYINFHWDKSTFQTTSDSLSNQMKKHAKGHTPIQYTQDALDFYEKNKHLGKPYSLENGSEGIKIVTKYKGGIFTKSGKIVTFWYENG